MTLKYPFGEFGNIQPIKAKDENDNDANLTGAILGSSFVYILSEDKVNVLLKITSTDFAIVTPNINWTPTKSQSEVIPPGQYKGEAWIKIGTAYTRYEFDVYIEKSRQNLAAQDF